MTLDITEQISLPEESPFVLNKYAGEKIKSKEEIIEQLQRLHLHGVPTPYADDFSKVKKITYFNLYLVPVFQQKVLGFYKITKNRTNNWVNSSVVKENKKIFFQKVNSLHSKKEQNRVKEKAIRAIYALNLDYGLVKIGVSAGTKPWVLFVNPHPEATDEIIDLFNKEISMFKGQWESSLYSQKKVKLGADPEFMLQSQTGQLVLASKYLPKNGIAGCDQIWVNRDRTQLPIAELRPKPAEEPRALIINLYKSMLVASKKITDPRLRWLAGSMPITGYPIGGHIHFSNIWLNSFLLRALDNYVALLITLFEDRNGSKRRPKYGFLGDYREQFHGGFEYRTLPSWIISPKLTRGIFALSKIIVENYQNLYQNPLRDITVQKAYYSGDKETLRPIVRSLWREVKQLKDFNNYKEYLQPLEELMNVNYSWSESTDIRKPWLLPPFNKNK